MTSKQLAEYFFLLTSSLQKGLDRFTKEQIEDECGCLHENLDEDELPWAKDFEIHPKTLEFTFKYDIDFSQTYVNGRLKIPKEYPSGDYLLYRGLDKPYTCDSGSDFYETLVLVFRQFERERLGESVLPTPSGQESKEQTQWDDIGTQIFQDEYSQWLTSCAAAKTKPRGTNKGGRAIIEYEGLEQMHRFLNLKIMAEDETSYLPITFFYGKDYLEDFGDQSLKLISEEPKLATFVEFINTWIQNHYAKAKLPVHVLLERCAEVYQEGKKRALKDIMTKSPWYDRVDDEDREAESYFRAVWTPIIGKDAVQKEVLLAVDAKHAIMKQLDLVKKANTKDLGFEVRSYGQNVYKWQIKMTGFQNEYYTLHKDLKTYAEKYKSGLEIIAEALFPSDFPDKPPFLRICTPRLQYLTGNTRYDGTFTHIPALTLYSKHVDMVSLLKAVRQTLINGKARVDLKTNWGYDKIAAGRAFLRERRTVIPTEGKWGGKFIVHHIESARGLSGFQEPYHDLENGNNILLPFQAREQITTSPPLMIEYKTPEGEISYCGVLDFCVAQNKIVVFPKWMMKHSAIQNGDEIEIRLVKLPRPDVKKGHSVKIQPHSKEFYTMQGPDIALAQRLSNFTTLAEGQTIPILDIGSGIEHLVQITRTDPLHAINIKVGHGEEFDLLYDVVAPFDEELKKPEVDEFDNEENNEDEIDDSVDLITKEFPKMEIEPEKKPKEKKEPPKFFRPEKPVLGEGDIECDNCHKAVKKSNQIHFIQCARINFCCKKCSSVIKNDAEEKKKHEAEFHTVVTCKCGKSMDKWELVEHEWMTCPDRLIECKWCYDDYPQKDLEKHEVECSNKVKNCNKCHKGIPKKDLQVHQENCTGPEKKVVNKVDSKPNSTKTTPKVTPTVKDPKKDKGILGWFHGIGKKGPNEHHVEQNINIVPESDHQHQNTEFTCSLCSFPGMTKEQFVEHLFVSHSGESDAQIIINSLLN